MAKSRRSVRCKKSVKYAESDSEKESKKTNKRSKKAQAKEEEEEFEENELIPEETDTAEGELEQEDQDIKQEEEPPCEETEPQKETSRRIIRLGRSKAYKKPKTKDRRDDCKKEKKEEPTLQEIKESYDSDRDGDEIFRRYAYDYENNKYMQMDERLYPKNRKRTKEQEEEEEEPEEIVDESIPESNINVSLSKRNKIVKKRPLEPLSFKKVKVEVEDEDEQDDLESNDQDSCSKFNRSSEKENIDVQNNKYAAKIGYLPDYEWPPKPLRNKENDLVKIEVNSDGLQETKNNNDTNQNLKQTLISPEFAENGDTTMDQMEWELDSKLTERELEYLSKQKKRIIVWINNNIRMEDNYLLCKAIQLSSHFNKEEVEIIPIFVFNTKIFMPKLDHEKELESDEPRLRGIQRTRLILESVIELKENLKKINSDLMIFIDEPHLAIKKLIRTDRENFVVFEYEISPIEKKAEENVCKMALKNKTKVWRVWGWTAVHIEDLPYSLDKFPHLFGKFKKDIANISIRELLDPPALDEIPFPSKENLFAPGIIDFVKSKNNIDYVPNLDDFLFKSEDFKILEKYDQRIGRDLFVFKGGEKSANERLNEYLWEKDIVSKHHYSKTSFFVNGDFAPKLTPWTSIGAISPRKVFMEILKYEQKNGSSEQSEWFKREMLWKDYFVFWALKHHKVYFSAEYGIYNRTHYEWQTNPEVITKIKTGKTGMPIIDAIVRDFIESGHMSYKAKMIFWNYFSQDLRQDWRKGWEFFEARMIDYEPCEIVGKWHQGAGIGPGRIVKYNWLTQSQDHDKKGEYIKRWVEELVHVPDEYIHDPWRMPIYLQKESNAIIGVDYPKPISWLRYTHENKAAHVDRTKTVPKKGKILSDWGQASLLTFIQVTKEKEKLGIQSKVEDESDKENNAIVDHNEIEWAN